MQNIDDINEYQIAPRYKGKISKDMIDAFDNIVKNCPEKCYVTNEYGRFLFDMPNKSVYLIYRRQDVMPAPMYLNQLSILIELCNRKQIKFFYEPEISN
jgi:hypothetical protein